MELEDPYWLVLLGLVVWLVSAGPGLMPLRSPFSLALVATATTPQSVRILALSILVSWPIGT
jgi:hypothetical protein